MVQMSEITGQTQHFHTTLWVRVVMLFKHLPTKSDLTWRKVTQHYKRKQVGLLQTKQCKKQLPRLLKSPTTHFHLGLLAHA